MRRFSPKIILITQAANSGNIPLELKKLEISADLRITISDYVLRVPKVFNNHWTLLTLSKPPLPFSNIKLQFIKKARYEKRYVDIYVNKTLIVEKEDIGEKYMDLI